MSKFLEMPEFASKFAIGEIVFVKEGATVAARQIGSIKCIVVARPGEPNAVITTEVTYQLSGGYTYEEDRIYDDPYEALGIPNPFKTELAAIDYDSPAYQTGDDVYVVGEDPAIIPRNAVFMAYSPTEEGVVLVQFKTSGNDKDFAWVDYNSINAGTYKPKLNTKLKPDPSDVAEAAQHERKILSAFQVNDHVRIKGTKEEGTVSGFRNNGVVVALGRRPPQVYAASELELLS